MKRLLAVALGLLVGAGCLETEKKGDGLWSSLLGRDAPPREMPKAPEEVAARVAKLGRDVVAANPSIGVHVNFITIGAAEPEIFHHLGQERWVVYVTEGLVRQCQGDGQLAAVLCRELGKATSERIGRFATVGRPLRTPSPYVEVGNDLGGRNGAADMTRAAELGRIDQERRQAAQPVAAPPPPDALARAYLVKSGYALSDLDAVTGLLRTADKNNTFEKQLTAAP